MPIPDFNGRVIFAVGSGRCGTAFLKELLSCDASTGASHERNPFNEAFHRYCEWHQLPIDHEGFLSTKEREIRQDLVNHQRSFEASPFLALSISRLYERFNAKFILLVRRPDEVVSSFWGKGWYRTEYALADYSKAPGYQEESKDYYFLCRITPRGEDFQEWNSLTRVGKLAWYWNTINLAALKQLEAIPKKQWRVIKLEEFSYETYKDLANFVGSENWISEKEYARIVRKRPGRRQTGYAPKDWSEEEVAEFRYLVKSAADRFQYNHDLDVLQHFVPRTNTGGICFPFRAFIGKVWNRLYGGIAR